MRVNRGRSASASSASVSGCGASATSRGTMCCRSTAMRPGFYRLGEDEKRRATQAVDPVIGGVPQTEPFARHVAAWQIGQAPVIDAHVTIGVEQTYALTVCAEHPLPSQAALPLSLTVLTAEIRDFSPQ